MAGSQARSRPARILTDILLFRWLRRLYEWVLHWAETPYGEPMLGFLSFIESSFFPVPPDVLLVPLAISRPKKAFRYAGITVVTSVLGGMLGYIIGLFLWESVGIRIIQFYNLMDQYYIFREWYDRNVLTVTFLAGLTPLPYKVFTIAAGVMEANFGLFVLGSITSRSIRFFMEALFCYFGDFLSERVFKMPIKDAIDKYLNILAVAFAVALVGGFIVIQYILPKGTINLSTQAQLDPTGLVEVLFYSREREKEHEEKDQPLDYYLKVNNSAGEELASKEVLIPGYEKLLRFHHGEPSVEVINLENVGSEGSGEQVIALSFFTACEDTIPCTDGLLALYHLDSGKGLVQDWAASYPRLRHLGPDHDIIGEAEFKLFAEAGDKDFGLMVQIVRKDVRFEGKGRDRRQVVKTSRERKFFRFLEGRLVMIMDDHAGGMK
jgi:membrane protein YqaA with SNARE-associated domain